jgi:LacI family transcriptional regulator
MTIRCRIPPLEVTASKDARSQSPKTRWLQSIAAILSRCYASAVITLRDVAREADCSVATASRALSHGIHVDTLTRDRVRQAAERLGYRSNLLARSLRKQKTGTVGLVIPTLDKLNYAAAVKLLHDELSAHDYQLILCCHRDDPELEAKALRALAERQVDAIVHVPFSAAGASGVLGRDISIPIVELSRRSTAANVDAVIGDDHLGGYEAARHLLENGHRRLALVIGDDRLTTMARRKSGFERAVIEAGLPPSDWSVRSDTSSIGWARDTTAALLESDLRPTGLIAGSNQLSVGLVRAVQEAGLSTPKNVSLVAFSNADWCEILSPPITSYEIPQAEMGHMAAQLLLNRLHPAIDYDLQPRIVSFAGRLVRRDSVGPPPAN